MDQPLREIVTALKAAQNILILTHIHPDGDALGSQIALGCILEGLGKKVYMYGEDEVSRLNSFFPGCHRVATELPDLSTFDCAVALDCGDRFRLGRAIENLLKVSPFIVIDHHAGHKEFGDISWVEPKRASTGEMVYDLAVELGAQLSYEAAYCLYAAIVSDTGSFKYSQTTEDTFRIARELVKLGVKPADVAGKLFDNFTVNRLQLMRRVLNSLELYEDDQIAFIFATREMFAETGTIPADTETFINYPRSLDTVKVVVFLKETDSNLISVSMRSKGTKHDVAQIASSFGGGGHRNAAGFKLSDIDLPSLREKLLLKLLPMVQ